MVIELLTRRYPGMRVWLSQRITAVVMALYLVFFGIYFATSVVLPISFQAWQAFIQPWWIRVLNIVFFTCLSMHAWIGVRDVLRDYIFNSNWRAKIQLLVDLALIFCWVWLLVLVLG